MEAFWNRLIGSTYTPRKNVTPQITNDPASRLQRFQGVYNNVLDLFNRPRDLAKEGPLLNDANLYLERLITLLRDETRAPIPHSCIQYAKTTQMYAVIAKAATVSQYEPLIRSSISIYAALLDGEEEGFLTSIPFAKSLMRLVTKVVDSGSVVVGIETETIILELLFTVSAKIRLQPDILPVWFRLNTKFEAEDLLPKEKQSSFVGQTSKSDFPLCYLLIDRVHHEGRIGDFARTGLLYIVEATGRSAELEQWILNSDLPTLMCTGLGALYSQLARELSIVHFDADLAPVLAMSDYHTTHPKLTAESAYSVRHKAHMTTFLSYLNFFQDLLDHCRSSEVKTSLLDHFQVLFSRQLLFPSLLQSSDSDAGSSVAVLNYLDAMLQSLEYPDLVDSMLTYLFAIKDEAPLVASKITNPPSPMSLRRRESLLSLSAQEDIENVVQPDLFNLIDLIINNLHSANAQSVYAALQLTTTIITRQKSYAIGTLLKVQDATAIGPERTLGALHIELAQYTELARSLHRQLDLEDAYANLCIDARHSLEVRQTIRSNGPSTRSFILSSDDTLYKIAIGLLSTFFTNSIEVNLTLTQTIVSIALCQEIRLDNWCAVNPRAYRYEETTPSSKPWQHYLSPEEQEARLAVENATRRIIWDKATWPTLYTALLNLVEELSTVRRAIPNFEQLVAGRKIMLESYSFDGALVDNLPLLPQHKDFGPQVANNAQSSGVSGHDLSNNNTSLTENRANITPALSAEADKIAVEHSRSPVNANHPIFKPPPPEAPSTTDILMHKITFGSSVPGLQNLDSAVETDDEGANSQPGLRTASLNHVLTNVVVLQEFILELVAIMQLRAAIFGESELHLG